MKLDIEPYRVRPDLDLWVVPDFARDALGLDAGIVLSGLEHYPSRGQDDDIGLGRRFLQGDVMFIV